MELPEALRPLAALVGTLSGPEQVHATPWAPAGTAWARVSGSWQVDGRVLVQEQLQERDGSPAFRAVNVFSLDPATGEVLLYAFDSLGYPPDPPARGRWADGSLVLERATARGASRTSYRPTASGYRWAKVFRSGPGAPWAPFLDGEMSRDDGTAGG
ncbi:DUF1579 domain-containing protein [Nakamurella endophytica]|uniref:DUF1579 domain-containing protein n=1 Tax=Nakamurella endophytica TaxID=1748367 RepID=A0A917T9L3_9ACTN|nr:DUF1579 domain-containing protein [Nakamurella endophytica]GGM14931.1 DUF1579 domain-containing protein [Nakamurella endophytica]